MDAARRVSVPFVASGAAKIARVREKGEKRGKIHQERTRRGAILRHYIRKAGFCQCPPLFQPSKLRKNGGKIGRAAIFDEARTFMFCTECGAKNAEDSKFCKQCGQKTDRARISAEAYTEALPDAEQALELLESAYALRTQGDAHGAIAMCERALKIVPESAAAHSLLGQLCIAQGDRERAIREYERVVQLNPGSIADRVKLDELRDETPRRRTPGTGTPLFTGGRETGGAMLTWITVGAAAVALLAAGLVLSRFSRAAGAEKTLATVPSSAPASVRVSDSIPSASGASGANFSAVSGGSGYAANPPSARNGDPMAGAPGGAAKAENPARAASSPVASGDGSTPFPTTAPPSDPLPSIGPNPANALPVIAPTAAKPKAKTRQPAPAKRAADGASQNRIVLDGDGKTPEEGSYTIHINTGGAAPSNTAVAKNSIHMARESGETEAAPAGDARSFIAIADDLRYKGDFEKAIQMYQRALPGAGDRAAHVYHQMAYCFQAKGDGSSAKVNYERAIEAYQKQAASGKNAESAKNGIRACQAGIKVCN